MNSARHGVSFSLAWLWFEDVLVVARKSLDTNKKEMRLKLEKYNCNNSVLPLNYMLSSFSLSFVRMSVDRMV